jgi:N-acetylglucosaminyl-diphospho-decaprenol L-rhamnosyltransferase
LEQFPSRERTPVLAMEPRVSAIIVVRGLGPGKAGQTRLDLCLRSVLIEPWVDDVIIVDNGNAPDVASGLRALQADRRDVRIVGAPIGASFSVAANMGAAQARGQFVLFLSPDVVLRRGAVQRMCLAGAENDAPWIVGGRLTDTEGRDRRVARVGKLGAFSALAVALELNAPRVKSRRPRAVGAVSGALMLTPRENFQAMGGFDPSFASDHADLDLCLRFARSGGRIVFQPEASGVQFAPAEDRRRKPVQGLALFAAKSARSAPERAFAAIALPLLGTVVVLKDLVLGRPPSPR